MNQFNRDVLIKLIEESHLTYTPLFTAKPHVFISKSNPLANKKSIRLEELENYPYLSYEQGINNSFYFAEEILPQENHKKSIVVSDRATLFNLLIGLDGYTLATGILNTNLNGDQILSIPLEIDDQIELVYLQHQKSQLSKMGEAYISYLKEEVSQQT